MRVFPHTGIGCLLLACAVVLTACDGGGDSVQQAVREASAAHQAAALKDGTVTTAQGVERPAGSEADQAFAARMIAHQQQGVAMADAALVQSSDPAVRRMAQSIKDRQTREIAEMQTWRPATD